MPLMTYDEYYEKGRHPIPYYLTLHSGQQYLYYFGEAHSFDPNHPQWPGQKKFWNEFLIKTQNQPGDAGQKRIVFIEGGKRPNLSTEEESIIKHGGMGLATYEAYQAGIETYSPEPDEKWERAQLEKEFSRNEIQCYYFARVVHQWHRKTESTQPDFEIYLNGYLEMDKKESGWTDFDFSLDAMKKSFTEIVGQNFDLENTNLFYDVINPTIIKTVVNRVSRLSSELRDMHIVGEIQKYMADGYSIFAQYGCSHVVMQEPLLRELLNDNEANI